MQKIFSLAKIASKASFQSLRARGPFYCEALGAWVSVTKLFYEHIVYGDQKKRKASEIAERLIMLPLIPEILNHGDLREKRTNDSLVYIQIGLEKYGYCFSVIVLQTSQQRQKLISCFVDHTKKRSVSDSNVRPRH